MKIKVKVHPRARRVRLSGGPEEYKLDVTAPPADGAANQAVIEFFARGLRLPKSSVCIVAGQTSRHKILEFPDAHLRSAIDHLKS
jgi:uncharacterized protein (TIGR00251 family)